MNSSLSQRFAWIKLFFYLTAFIFFFFLYHYLYDFIYDLYTHLKFVEQISSGHIGVPHFLYHLTVYGISKILCISFLNASCLVLAGSMTASIFIIEHILNGLLEGRYSRYLLLFAASALSIISSIYLPFLNTNPYRGAWSPNPWHNPTFIMARPFVLLSFYLFTQGPMKGDLNPGYAKWISVLLAVGALVKPSFVLAFAPACLLYWLLFSRKLSFLRTLILIHLPVMAVLFLQFLFAYGSNSSNSIGYNFFGIWLLHADSVFWAVLQAAAFPLTVLVVLIRRLSMYKDLVFAWMLFVIGFLVLGLFTEIGGRQNTANFAWTYMFALNILFIYSVAALLREISVKRLHPAKIVSVALIFGLHLLSGIFYLAYILLKRDI